MKHDTPRDTFDGSRAQFESWRFPFVDSYTDPDPVDIDKDLNPDSWCMRTVRIDDVEYHECIDDEEYNRISMIRSSKRWTKSCSNM